MNAATATTAPEAGAQRTRHTAGVFDVRTIISLLLGIYGVVLLICSFALDPGVNPDTGAAKNATDNLCTGLGMLVVAAGLLAWARLRPILVPDDPDDPDAPAAPPEADAAVSAAGGDRGVAKRNGGEPQ